ncbi:MAG: hypothetical protein FIB02_03935 [Desulfuromonas sp.]|nr:hypothetical protein [Desulfuromonas sp.]
MKIIIIFLGIFCFLGFADHCQAAVICTGVDGFANPPVLAITGPDSVSWAGTYNYTVNRSADVSLSTSCGTVGASSLTNGNQVFPITFTSSCCGSVTLTAVSDGFATYKVRMPSGRWQIDPSLSVDYGTVSAGCTGCLGNGYNVQRVSQDSYTSYSFSYWCQGTPHNPLEWPPYNGTELNKRFALPDGNCATFGGVLYTMQDNDAGSGWYWFNNGLRYGWSSGGLKYYLSVSQIGVASCACNANNLSMDDGSPASCYYSTSGSYPLGIPTGCVTSAAQQIGSCNNHIQCQNENYASYSPLGHVRFISVYKWVCP